MIHGAYVSWRERLLRVYDSRDGNERGDGHRTGSFGPRSGSGGIRQRDLANEAAAFPTIKAVLHVDPQLRYCQAIGVESRQCTTSANS